MRRTQISLHEKEYKLAKKEAQRLGISLAAFFRQSLRVCLPINKKQPWMRFAGSVESGDPQSSTTIDEIVYGHKD